MLFEIRIEQLYFQSISWVHLHKPLVPGFDQNLSCLLAVKIDNSEPKQGVFDNGACQHEVLKEVLGYGWLLRAVLFSALVDLDLVLFPFSNLFSVIFVVKENLIDLLNQINFSTLVIELSNNYRCVRIELSSVLQYSHLE